MIGHQQLCYIVRLQSTMSGISLNNFFKSVVDDVLGVVTLQEKVSHLLSCGFEVVIDETKTAAKS